MRTFSKYDRMIMVVFAKALQILADHLLKLNRLVFIQTFLTQNSSANEAFIFPHHLTSTLEASTWWIFTHLNGIKDEKKIVYQG